MKTLCAEGLEALGRDDNKPPASGSAVEKPGLVKKFSTALLALQRRPGSISRPLAGDKPVDDRGRRRGPQSMPTTLCIWMDNFHCGWSMQYATAALVFCFCSTESMGWRKKCSKARPWKRSGMARGCG